MTTTIENKKTNHASGEVIWTASPRMNGIEEYYFSKKLAQIATMNEAGHKVINLGIGNPDLPPHISVIEALYKESLKPNQHGYQSYRGSYIFRKAIADWYMKWYGVNLDPEKNILPLMGSKEGIMHICMAYLGPGDTALVPDPGYPTYRSAAMLAGAHVQAYTLSEKNGWFPDIELLEKTTLSAVKMMFVNYPHMPTGTPPSHDLFQSLISFAKRNHILICHDNPYSFILNETPVSLLKFDDEGEHVIELNSLSKSHNMAGWRVGFLCGNAVHINNILKFKSNMDSGMFLPVQLAATKALALGHDWFSSLNKIYQERQQKVFELLKELLCYFPKTQAGLFVWASIPANFENGIQFSDYLLERYKIFVTPGEVFGEAGKKYIRISLCADINILEEARQRIKNNAS